MNWKKSLERFNRSRRNASWRRRRWINPDASAPSWSVADGETDCQRSAGTVVDAKRAKFERLKNDYELLAPEAVDGVQETFADSLITSLNQAYSRRDEITTSLSQKRQQKMKLTADIERREQQIRQIRRELETATASSHAIQLDKAKIETRLENNLARLTSEYQLTYEYARTKVEESHIENAREEVLQLRLGNRSARQHQHERAGRIH